MPAVRNAKWFPAEEKKGFLTYGQWWPSSGSALHMQAAFQHWTLKYKRRGNRNHTKGLRWQKSLLLGFSTIQSTRERKLCALDAFRLHQQWHPSTRTRPRRAGITQAPETSGSDFPACTAHPSLLQGTQLELVGRGNYSPISTNVTTISESVGCVLAVCSQ